MLPRFINFHKKTALRALGFVLGACATIPHPVLSQSDLTYGLTGDWWGLRPELEDRGIMPHASITTEAFATVDGGLQRGIASPGVLDVGVELDLEKLLGWNGAGLTANALIGYGVNATTQYIGDYNVVSNIYAGTNFNVFRLFLSQTFGEDFVYLKAGQLALDDDFMVSESASLFINSAFAPLPTQSGNIPSPIYPLTAPGAFIRVTPSAAFSIQAGIYAGSAGSAQSDNQGFQWRTGGGAGWGSFVEAEYRYERGVVKVGGYYQTGEFNNFRTNQTVQGLSGFYALIDHQFVAPSDRSPGLSGFLRGGVAPQGERVTVGRYVDAGFVIDQILSDGDALGLGFSHTVFSDDYLTATPGVTSRESVIELTYQFAITDLWMIQPDVQWVLDSHFAQNDALVMGVRTEVIF